jgi:hypothetical protein
MGFGDLEGEAGGHRRVEGVAAVFEHRHTGGRSQPMRRRHHAMGSG